MIRRTLTRRLHIDLQRVTCAACTAPTPRS
ncbi:MULTISPECIES: putative leader peptide [Mycobacterium]